MKKKASKSRITRAGYAGNLDRFTWVDSDIEFVSDKPKKKANRVKTKKTKNKIAAKKRSS